MISVMRGHWIINITAHHISTSAMKMLILRWSRGYLFGSAAGRCCQHENETVFVNVIVDITWGIFVQMAMHWGRCDHFVPYFCTKQFIRIFLYLSTVHMGPWPWERNPYEWKKKWIPSWVAQLNSTQILYNIYKVVTLYDYFTWGLKSKDH